MELPFYVTHSYEAVNDIKWYLDRDLNIRFYEKLQPSLLLGNKEYEIESLDFLNKLYYVFNKLCLYSDNLLFIRDYLAVISLNGFVTDSVNTNIFFFKSLLEVIDEFDNFELPNYVNRAITDVLNDLNIISEYKNSKEEDSKSDESANNGKEVEKERIKKTADHEMIDKIKRSTNSTDNNTVGAISKDILNDINRPRLDTAKVTFENMIKDIDKKKGWEYSFNSLENFNFFVETIINYLVLGEVKDNVIKIPLCKGAKTRFATVLNGIYNKYPRENNLSTDTNYLKVIRVIKDFEYDTDNQLYKTITRSK